MFNKMLTYSESLFNEYDLTKFLTRRQQRIAEDVNAIPKEDFLEISTENLIEQLSTQNRITPLALDMDGIYREPTEECKIDVSQDRSRYIPNRNKPFYIDGIKITIKIPFSGEKELFKFRPSRWQTGGIMKFTIESNELCRTYKLSSDANHEEISSQFGKEIKNVENHLEYQAADIQKYNEALEGIVRQAIKAKQEKIQKQNSISDNIGIPLK